MHICSDILGVDSWILTSRDIFDKDCAPPLTHCVYLSVKEEEHLNILGEKDVAPVGRWKV